MATLTNNDVSHSVDYQKYITEEKIPLFYKILQGYISFLEKVSPRFASNILFKLFTRPRRKKINERMKKYYHGKNKSFIEFSGKSIFICEWNINKNNGKKILVNHGWSSAIYQMRHMIEKLAEEGFHVIAYDGPAHGMSTGKYTNLVEFAHWIKYLSDLKGPFHGVVNHSFGGPTSFMALDLGMKLQPLGDHPRIVNLNIPASIYTATDPFFTKLNVHSKNLIEIFFERMEKIGNRDRDTYGVSKMNPSLVKSIEDPSYCDILFIHDHTDKVVASSEAEILHSAYFNSQIFLFNGQGHNHILKDKNIIQRVVDFLKS